MIENFDVFEDKHNGCFQLRTKTNSYALEFDSQEKTDIFLGIVDTIKSNPDSTLKDLKRAVLNNDNEPQVLDVLNTLHEYGLLPYTVSGELDGGSQIGNGFVSGNNAMKCIEDTVISVLGNGGIADRIKKVATEKGFKGIHLHAYESTKDIEGIVSQSDFLLVDANHWSPFHLELINQFALQYNKPWLYIGGIEDFSIKVGPLFYGKETGCYNCLISRVKSNHEYPTFLNAYEDYLRDKKQASQPDVIPSPEVIYEIVASFAVLEVVKFYEQWSLPATWRKVINLELASFNLSKHTLLKKPFCEVCKPELEYNPAPWLEAVTLK